MKAITKILVALDFSETTVMVVEKARQVLDHIDAEMIPVHAAEEVHDYPFFHVDAMKTISEEVASKMEEHIDILVRLGARIRHSVIQEGKPEDVILSVADRFSVDLIMLGAARKDFLHRLFGSTAEAVIRHAGQPIWLIHPQDQIAEYKHALCAIDRSPHSVFTVDAAISLCRLLNLDLCVLHVVPDGSQADGEESADKLATGQPDEAELQLLDRYLERFDLTGVRHRNVVRHGAVAELIRRSVDEFGCDLLIMGATHRPDGTTILTRGTVEKVLRTVNCSLVAIKHAETTVM